MERAPHPVVGFLTDFGFDGAAATCRAVILGICPDAQIVDISHSVAKYAIADGAFLLRAALPYFPVGTHVAVVDPGVGTERRPIAIRAGRGDVLVGPDNGLLVEPAEALDGIAEARQLTNRDLWLPQTSSTFHGRDIFAPVTARLAAGIASFADVGDRLDPGELVRLPGRRGVAADGRIDAEVAYVDSFGNLRLSAPADALDRAFGTMPPGSLLRASVGEAIIDVRFAPSFGHVSEGEGLVYRDSAGNVALALNGADLAARLGVATGAPVSLTRPD